MSASVNKKLERLEVEDEEEREQRIQSILEKINADSQPPNTVQPQPGPPKFDFGDRTTFAVAPPTELLSRIQAFLPQLEASNTELAERARDNPESVDIEHVDEDAERYIEMNLGLGLFEARNRTTKDKEGSASESGSGSSSSSSSSFSSLSSSSSSSSSDYDSSSSSSNDSGSGEEDSDSDIESGSNSESAMRSPSQGPSSLRPTKPLPRRSLVARAPQIVVLSESASTEDATRPGATTTTTTTTTMTTTMTTVSP